MLAVSLKWRLGVVRRRPKGTEQRSAVGAGGATGEAPSLPLVPAFSQPVFVRVLEVSL